MLEHIHGLIAAPFTAMQADGSLALSLVAAQAERLKHDGIRGAFVCGTTGEGLSLTVAERKQLAVAWVEAAGDAFPIIVHVGHSSLETALGLARHAQEVGAHGVAAMPASPFYSGAVQEVAEMCRLIAAAAPALPFFYYHIPTFSGVYINVHDLLLEVRNTVPNFQGVKFTHTDLMDYARCLRFDEGRFDLLFGRDEILLSALVLGTKGAVGSTYNFLGPLFNRLMQNFGAGDVQSARACQAAAQETVASLLRLPGLPAQKALMGLLGQDLGPVRPPLQNLRPEMLTELRMVLETSGIRESFATNAERVT